MFCLFVRQAVRAAGAVSSIELLDIMKPFSDRPKNGEQVYGHLFDNRIVPHAYNFRIDMAFAFQFMYVCLFMHCGILWKAFILLTKTSTDLYKYH